MSIFVVNFVSSLLLRVERDRVEIALVLNGETFGRWNIIVIPVIFLTSLFLCMSFIVKPTAFLRHYILNGASLLS